MSSIKIKMKRLGALLAALMLSIALCSSTAFAAPAYDADTSADSDAVVDVVDEESADVVGPEQDSNPFGKSYIVKGVAVVGVGVVFYVVLSIKTKKK